MKKTVIKNRIRRFSKTGSALEIIDWGYNDFDYIEPLKTPRVISNYLIHFVIKGSGTLECNGKTFKVKENEIFCLPPDALIAYYPNENDLWKYFWINFDGVEGREIFKSMGFSDNCPVKSAVTSEEALAMFRSLLSSRCSQKESYYKVKSILYSIAGDLCEDKRADTFIKGSDLAERVKEILRLNYKNPMFSVDVIADVMHVSHSYVCRLFKEQTGQTLIKYLVNYRLEKAAELLADGEYLVKDLSNMVGFNDELHFMKEFKKKYGVTVKQYAAKTAKKSS